VSNTESVSWRPSAGIPEARQRALRLRQARGFFEQRNVLEVDTPCIGEAAVSDVNIENIGTTLTLSAGQKFYLQTSPEFYMKRLLAAGFPDIFEICKVFRDAELGRRHQPEFTMVEWYRLGFGLDEIISETVDFIEALIDPSRLSARADQLSYCEAFTQFTGIDPLTAGIEELLHYLDADQDLRSSIGDSQDDALDLILATRVSKHFASDRLTVIHHYPASQAALARITPDDDRVADRFEVFLGSLELANGYVELTDAVEQRQRCEADQEKRKNRGAIVRPLDDKFLASLDSGLPACAGVAVGFDRLLLIDLETSHLGETRHFPIEMT
jgi:lysyl-tRNA synthetase class 2